VARVWIESGVGAAEGLRARIVSTLDLSAAAEVVTVAASAEEILAAVDDWLQRFLTAGDECGLS